jgi:hypothetical protein
MRSRMAVSVSRIAGEWRFPFVLARGLDRRETLPTPIVLSVAAAGTPVRVRVS